MKSKGQSVIEIIVAVAIFVIIASSSVIAVIGSFSTTRLGEEETVATLITTEGHEAVQSIRNQNWENLVDGNYGLDNSTGSWKFAGTSDTDPSGKFTRVVNILSVERGESGEIVLSGGVVDEDTKKITVTTSWNFTPSRNNSAEIITYLTNWQKSKSQAGAGSSTITTCNEYCVGVGLSGGYLQGKFCSMHQQHRGV